MPSMQSIFVLAAAFLMSLATAADSSSGSAESTTAAPAEKKEFPLIWVCLGVTVVGVIIALYVAYRRPEELHLPGSVVMTAQETDQADDYDDARKGYSA